MTVPSFVEAATVSGFSASSGNIDFPATVLPGEGILLIVSNDGGGDTPSIDTIGNWDYLVSGENNGGAGHMIAILEAVGDEDGTTLAISITSSEGVTGSMIRIADWDSSSLPEISARVEAGNDDWQAITALTPSWDSSTIDTLWIAGMSAIDGGGGRSISGYPVGFNDNQSLDKGATSTAYSAHAYATQENLTVSLGYSQVNSALDGNADHSVWLIAIRGVSDDTTDDLLADDIESVSEVINPTIEQNHSLATTSNESASELTAPAVTEESEHILLANSIESISEIINPIFEQSHIIQINDIQSLSDLSIAILQQNHTLLSVNIESITELNKPESSEASVLFANNIESISEITNPIFEQSHTIQINDIQSLSDLSIATLQQNHTLLSINIESITELNNPILIGDPFTYTMYGEVFIFDTIEGNVLINDTIMGEISINDNINGKVRLQ